MTPLNETKILIVEDEAIVALEIQTRLSMMGYKVCGIAASGEKAIQLTKETFPSLILMDIKLKGKMNGLDAAEIITDKYSTPSIFITAFSDESTIRQIKNSRNKNFLLKPLREDEMKNAIMNLTGGALPKNIN